MLSAIHVVAAASPPPTGDQPLPSAASNLGTILFFFIVLAIVAIGFLMVRSMRRVNSNYGPGPNGTYIGDDSSSDVKSEKSEKSGKSSDS